jgi:SAM-dependent methyltransferase
MMTQTLDETRLHEYMGKILNDFGAAVSAPLVLLGDRLGLFRCLAQEGPLRSKGLAERTGTSERYVREWLASMAASGYVDYDAATGQFSMSPEQSAVFADERSPVLMTGGFYSISSVFADAPRVEEAFRSGQGIEWGAHDSCLFCGVERFFRPSYRAHLIGEWLPALDGVVERLERGARVADVGCGHGVSTLIMAEAFPRSRFVGFDLHEASIRRARRSAGESGLSNVSFEVSTAKQLPGTWDLVTCFDCLHDMGDPAGAAAHVHASLAEDGTWMVVEPIAGDRLEDNLNPVGRIYYSFSTTVCTPTSLSQEVGAALGAQAGEARLREVIEAGGFRRVRRAAETPFNVILEARK